MKAFAALFGRGLDAGRMLIWRFLPVVAPQFLSKLTYFHWRFGERPSTGTSFAQQLFRSKETAKTQNGIKILICTLFYCGAMVLSTSPSSTAAPWFCLRHKGAPETAFRKTSSRPLPTPPPAH